ncbi:MAG: 50S ribosomal protein L11 methyltransferase [Pseudomonadota bacterium]|nr:50S ribosomal protein L11 methyltransferase [Pseudomonadota bacterium]
MPWLQVHLLAPRADTEAVEDALLDCGAVSVTLADSADNPILEPGVGETPLWETVKVTGLFELPADRALIAAQFVALQPGFGAADLHWEEVADQPWERAWMDHFEPIQCGGRLWICPSWREPPDPDAVNLRLDPGLAFGSGTHPTTFLCLEWLDGIDLAGTTVIDYGCGSGILGIAALLLGADRVIAVDNDPQALIATRDNLERNGLGAERLSTHLPADMPDASADILVANILAGPLISLAPRLDQLTRLGGRLCLSGLTLDQAQAVMAAYPGFRFEPIARRDDWVRLGARKDAGGSGS